MFGCGSLLALSLLPSTELFGEERVFGARLSDRPTPRVLARLSKTGLSRREYEVLQLVGMGQTNPEIAELLGLTRNREDVPAQRDG